MKSIFIEYPKCSTCQKAEKWLKENKIEYEKRNIVEETKTLNIFRRSGFMVDIKNLRFIMPENDKIYKSLLLYENFTTFYKH